MGEPRKSFMAELADARAMADFAIEIAKDFFMGDWLKNQVLSQKRVVRNVELHAYTHLP